MNTWDLGYKILYLVTLIIFSPFFILWHLYKYIKVAKSERSAMSSKSIDEMAPVNSVLEKTSEELTINQALIRLNRLPTKGDDLFLIGITEEKEYYVLLPKPMHLGLSSLQSGELVGVKYNLERFWRMEHETKKMLEPDDLVIKKAKDILEFESIPSASLAKIYYTKQQDFIREFRSYNKNTVYLDYITHIQKVYFEEKESLLNKIRIETNQIQFDELVKKVKSISVPNEEIVKMMMENQTQSL
jgi:hypothetical protein